MTDFFENNNQEKLKKEAENRKEHYLWCEKYRPLVLENFIGNDLVKDKARQFIDTNDIPHLLLHGKAGGGKTTLAMILAKTINCDYMYINASSENSVDDVREKITLFASSMAFKPLKIIVLDEADFLTPQAQAALRSVMETFSQTTRFILTCNYIEKIIEPLISRCQIFNLLPPSKKEVASHVFSILRKEDVESNPADLKFIIDSMYPDIRRVINTLQSQVVSNKLVINQKEMIDSDYKLKIIEILSDKRVDKKTSFKNIRQTIADNSVSDFNDMYKLLYDKIEEYATGHIAPVIVILSEMQYQASFVVDKEITFVATITKILNEIK